MQYQFACDIINANKNNSNITITDIERHYDGHKGDFTSTEFSLGIDTGSFKFESFTDKNALILQLQAFKKHIEEMYDAKDLSCTSRDVSIKAERKRDTESTEAAKLRRETTQNIGTVHSFHGNPTELKFGSLNELEAIDTSNGLTTKVIIYLIKNEYYKQIPGGNLLKWNTNTNKWEDINKIINRKSYFAIIDNNELKYKDEQSKIYTLDGVSKLEGQPERSTKSISTQQQPYQLLSDADGNQYWIDAVGNKISQGTDHHLLKWDGTTWIIWKSMNYYASNTLNSNGEVHFYEKSGNFWIKDKDGKNCYWWDDPNKTASGWYVIGDANNTRC